MYQVAEAGTSIQSNMALQFAHDAAQSSPILDAAWALTGPQIVTVGVNNQVMLYDCQSQQSQQLGSHDQPVRTVRFMADQPNTLVTGSWDKTIRFWQTNRQGPVETKQMPERVYAMDYAGPHLVVATANRRIVTYDVRNMAQPLNVAPSQLKWQTRAIGCFPAMPAAGGVDASQAGYAVGSIEGRVGISYHDQQYKERNFSFKCHRCVGSPPVIADARSKEPPKTTKAIGSSMLKPQTTDPADPKFGAWAVNCIAVTHKGTFATGGSDGTIAIWDQCVSL